MHEKPTLPKRTPLLSTEYIRSAWPNMQEAYASPKIPYDAEEALRDKCHRNLAIWSINQLFDPSHRGQERLTFWTDLHISYLERLISLGIDLNVEGDYNTPFNTIFSSEKKIDKEVLIYCIDQGAYLNVVDKYGNTAFHYICQNHYEVPGLIEYCIEKGADLNIRTQNVKNKAERTPLQILVQNKVSEELITYCLENKADLNIKDNFGITVFMYLCITRKITVETLERYIGYGADCKAQSNNGATYFNDLCGNENITLEVIQYCIKRGENFKITLPLGSSAFHDLCRNIAIDEKIIRYCLTQGADLNVKDKLSYTPFHYLLANESLNESILMYCIEKGGDLKALSKDGETPFHILCGKKQLTKKMLQYSLGRVGDLLAKTSNSGSSAFLFLCKSPFVNVELLECYIGYCMQKKVNVMLPDKYGATPMHYLCDSPGIKQNAVELLLKCGEDLNKPNLGGFTPFYFLGSNKATTEEIVKYCLDQKANPNLRAATLNATPFSNLLSTHKVSEELVKYCLAKGANLNIQTYPLKEDSLSPLKVFGYTIYNFHDTKEYLTPFDYLHHFLYKVDDREDKKQTENYIEFLLPYTLNPGHEFFGIRLQRPYSYILYEKNKKFHWFVKYFSNRVRYNDGCNISTEQKEIVALYRKRFSHKELTFIHDFISVSLSRTFIEHTYILDNEGGKSFTEKVGIFSQSNQSNLLNLLLCIKHSTKNLNFPLPKGFCLALLPYAIVWDELTTSASINVILPIMLDYFKTHEECWAWTKKCIEEYTEGGKITVPNQSQSGYCRTF